MMKKILFHHIPKTAGTSLIAQARTLFGRCVHDGRYDEQLSDQDILDERFRFYHGHFTRGFVLRFRSLVPDSFIFTFVRHPFNRTLSQYYNWTDAKRVERELDVVSAQWGETNVVRELRKKFRNTIFSMSLKEFLLSEDLDVLQATNNLQAQYMTLSESTRDHIRFHKAAVNGSSFYDFVGVQELYEPSLRILEIKCGLAPECLGGATRANVSDYAKHGGSYQITSEECRLLEARNIYDLVLYHTCYIMLLKEYREWLPSNAEAVEDLINLPLVVDKKANGNSAFEPRTIW